jgi:sugar lactone lactonase YvrE
MPPPGPTAKAIKVTLVYPASAFQNVRAALRTQGTVPAADLTPEDLRRLQLSFQGRPLTPDQYTISDMAYDEAANLVVTLLLDLQGSGVLRVATPADAFVLLAAINLQTGGAMTVDAGSTAQVLLDRALAGQPTLSPTDRQGLYAILLRKVHQLFGSSRPGNVERDADVQGTVDRITTAAHEQTPLDSAVLTKIEIPPSKGGGGGGVAVAAIGSVTTLAGNQALPAGFLDDTGTAARFNSPRGLAVDTNGNVYVADTTNHRIRQITPAGVVTTVAGDGTAGFLDHATGTSAQFRSPCGVAVDAAGNLYVADTDNHRIRKIAAGGTREVTTVAGDGTGAGGAGAFLDHATGTSAQFNSPMKVAVDTAGNLFVADTSNNRIRKIAAGGTNAVTTLAGDGTAAFLDHATGTSAQFKQPRGVAVDAAGTVYVADDLNHKIRKIAAGGTNAVTTIAGSTNGVNIDNAVATLGKFSRPFDVVIDAAGHLFVADFNNNSIRKITAAGALETYAGGKPGVNSGGSPGLDNADRTLARFSGIEGIALDANGIVYVADRENRRICKVNP